MHCSTCPTKHLLARWARAAPYLENIDRRVPLYDCLNIGISRSRRKLSAHGCTDSRKTRMYGARMCTVGRSRSLRLASAIALALSYWSCLSGDAALGGVVMSTGTMLHKAALGRQQIMEPRRYWQFFPPPSFVFQKPRRLLCPHSRTTNLSRHVANFPPATRSREMSVPVLFAICTWPSLLLNFKKKNTHCSAHDVIWFYMCF